MRVPMQWLKQYTDIPVSAQAFQDAMINHGTGVEGLEDQNEDLQKRGTTCFKNIFVIKLGKLTFSINYYIIIV